MEPLTKKDLLDALQGVATKQDILPLAQDIKTIKQDIKIIQQDIKTTQQDVKTIQQDNKSIRSDLTNVELKVSDILERVTEIPTRGELGELIAKTYDLSTLKSNVSRIMQHLHLT
jgi:septal ring factor EnvC (AmiA/AmiB activator)